MDVLLGRLGLTASAMAWSAVGLPMLIGEFYADGPHAGPIWWGLYLAYGVCMFAVVYFIPFSWRRVHNVVLVLQVLLGVTLYALNLSWGFTAVLLGCSTAAAGFTWRFRGGLTVSVLQAIAVLIGNLRIGVWSGVIAMLAFGAFMVFITLMVEALLREAESREKLAQVNAELEEAQRRLADSARATERLRIARELHDLIGHQLTSLALELEVASHQSTGTAKARVERARQQAKTLLTDVREVVSQFREPDVDIATQLHAITDRVQRPAVHLDLADDVVITDARHAHALLRCVQELVTNAVRHAGADNLWVAITTGPDGVQLTAHDDGHGAPEVQPGNGLAGMQERFELVGGQVSFTTGPGNGFAVHATVPR